MCADTMDRTEGFLFHFFLPHDVPGPLRLPAFHSMTVLNKISKLI